MIDKNLGFLRVEGGELNDVLEGETWPPFGAKVKVSSTWQDVKAAEVSDSSNLI